MKTTPKILSAVLISFTALQFSARAETPQDFLREFHADPARTMQRLPSEVHRDGSVTARGFINENAVAWKIRTRNIPRLLVALEDDAPAQATQAPKDLAARLTEPNSLLSRLPDIENAKLLNVKIDPAPWADSYWPLYKGMTAVRYADPSFPDSKDWKTNRDYSENAPATAIFETRDQTAIDRLSPAEKYDLVMGDTDLTLTHFAWAQGQKQFETLGFVSTWMGICHGWAGASHMGAKFPAHAVTVTATNGQPVTFYPQDVKALQSMLWANANVPTRFVGSRCNVAKPPRNANGRILDQKCFDVDPATWHLAATTQMGVNKRSFVMDSTYDLEVWNYPVASFKVSYFNPQSWQQSKRFQSAAIPLSKFKLDKFPEFRAANTAYVVGVIMDVSHVAAITPNPGNPSSGAPPTKTLRYIYDLELDGDFNVIGGEWYTNAHPDFIWTFAPGSQAFAIGEGALKTETWSRDESVPSHWTDFARKGSARGEPLFSFVGKLADEAPAAEPVPPVEVPPTP